MKCAYCETEYGMSHTPYQCSAIIVKQRDKAREQMRVLREALRKLVIHHASVGCTSAFHADTCGEAYDALAATGSEGGDEDDNN